MMRTTSRPLLMGGIMGIMMLGMVHIALTGQSDLGVAAVAVFLGAHVISVLLLLTAAFCAARLAPSFRARLDRRPRPGLRHLAIMATGATIVFLATHLLWHGSA